MLVQWVHSWGYNEEWWTSIYHNNLYHKRACPQSFDTKSKLCCSVRFHVSVHVRGLFIYTIEDMCDLELTRTARKIG